MCGCSSYFYGCMVQLLQELYSLLTYLCSLVGALSSSLLGKLCPLCHRQPIRLSCRGSCRGVGSQHAYYRGNRSVDIPPSDDVFDVR